MEVDHLKTSLRSNLIAKAAEKMNVIQPPRSGKRRPMSASIANRDGTHEISSAMRTIMAGKRNARPLDVLLAVMEAQNGEVPQFKTRYNCSAKAIEHLPMQPFVRVAASKGGWRAFFKHVEEYSKACNQYNNQHNATKQSQFNNASHRMHLVQQHERLQALWSELKVPQPDRDYVTASFCTNVMNFKDDEILYAISEVEKQIELLISHRLSTIEALASITIRETCLQMLHEQCVYLDSNSNNISLDNLAKFIISLNSFRRSSQEVLKCLHAWRELLWQSLPFMWRGMNYLIKMQSDTEFLNCNFFHEFCCMLSLSTFDLALIYPTSSTSRQVSKDFQSNCCTIPETDIVQLKSLFSDEDCSTFFQKLSDMEMVIREEADVQKRVHMEQQCMFNQSCFIPLLRWLPGVSDISESVLFGKEMSESNFQKNILQDKTKICPELHGKEVKCVDAFRPKSRNSSCINENIATHLSNTASQTNFNAVNQLDSEHDELNIVDSYELENFTDFYDNNVDLSLMTQSTISSDAMPDNRQMTISDHRNKRLDECNFESESKETVHNSSTRKDIEDEEIEHSLRESTSTNRTENVEHTMGIEKTMIALDIKDFPATSHVKKKSILPTCNQQQESDVTDKEILYPVPCCTNRSDHLLNNFDVEQLFSTQIEENMTKNGSKHSHSDASSLNMTKDISEYICKQNNLSDDDDEYEVSFSEGSDI